MKTSLSHLPEHKQAELKAIVAALIPRFSEIEMIILFGSFARGTWVEDKYVEKGITYEYKSDYDLLIVLSKNGHANSDTLTQSITGKLEELNFSTPMNPIFHGVEFVNHELREGNYFFAEIKRDGVMLFTTNRYQLDEQREFSPAEAQTKAEDYFNGWFESATKFYDYFDFAFKREDYKEAAFLLHQAVERYYGALQLVFTGYKPKTHDIEILGKLAKSVDIEFGKVFPRATPQERQRFNLLKRAYIEARYNLDYKITKEDLEYLAERVTMLRSLTEQICKQKIESFTK
jgi:HEPN domain-containing protein/predicted nucleotidyltransferase